MSNSPLDLNPPHIRMITRGSRGGGLMARGSGQGGSGRGAGDARATLECRGQVTGGESPWRAPGDDMARDPQQPVAANLNIPGLHEMISNLVTQAMAQGAPWASEGLEDLAE